MLSYILCALPVATLVCGLVLNTGDAVPFELKIGDLNAVGALAVQSNKLSAQDWASEASMSACGWPANTIPGVTALADPTATMSSTTASTESRTSAAATTPQSTLVTILTPSTRVQTSVVFDNSSSVARRPTPTSTPDSAGFR